jgi:hypothetical protein
MNQAIEQDTEKLLQIKTFNFDLSNADFVQYFENRTGIMIRHNLTASGDKVLKSDSQWQESVWDINNPVMKFQFIIRARVQNAWELFQGVN